MKEWKMRYVVAALGLSEQAIRDHVTAGRLTAIRRGVRHEYFFVPDEVRAFAARYNYAFDEEALVAALATPKRRPNRPQ